MAAPWPLFGCEWSEEHVPAGTKLALYTDKHVRLLYDNPGNTVSIFEGAKVQLQ
jgi:hypothetical protein